MNSKFTGLGTALVTPFKQDGLLDEKALRELVQRQIRGGVNFLVTEWRNIGRKKVSIISISPIGAI